MPEMHGWDTDTFEKLERCEFDDPGDRRRFFEAGDNQIAGVGDGFERNSPAWIETVKSLRDDFPVYGSMGEANECLTRLVGQENTMLWMGEYPERMGAVINRIGAHYLECAKAAMDAAAGLLDGFVIWGDVAYKHGMFFSPTYWRRYFKPWVAQTVAYAHEQGLPVIYHGCGNVKTILKDFIEMGVDGYNPLEAKAGLDVVELRREYQRGIAFCGNNDITVWETNDLARIRREVLRKLHVAEGGGFVFMSDHSVSSAVSGKTYDYIVNLVRKYGRYPLALGPVAEQIEVLV
jgi:uroporphyrinogen-III decarboxylase